MRKGMEPGQQGSAGSPQPWPRLAGPCHGSGQGPVLLPHHTDKLSQRHPEKQTAGSDTTCLHLIVFLLKRRKREGFMAAWTSLSFNPSFYQTVYVVIFPFFLHRDGIPLPCGKALRTGVVSWRRLQEDFIVVLQSLKGVYKKDGDKHLSRTCCNRARGSHWK